MAGIKLFLMVLFFTASAFEVKSQYLSLDQLLALRRYSVADLEEFLTARNWTFTEANAETEEQLGIASFAYGRDYFETEKATMFLSYYYWTKSGTKRLSYQYHDPVHYNKLVTRAKALGFVLHKSEIKDDYLVKVYKKGDLVVRFKSIKETQGYRNVTLYTVLILPFSDWLFLSD